jgi:hypothetical protein
MRPLVSYLQRRPEGLGLLLPSDLERTLLDLFIKPEVLLPKPYKIFFTDEAQTPAIGFPVAETAALVDLDARVERWLAEEAKWQVDRDQPKERVQQAFGSYVVALMKLAENAILSNLLADYHAIFWLAHSNDLARHFSTLPRRVGQIDTQIGRTQGDVLKYRIYQKWATEMREQMSKLATRVAPVLDGEQERALSFFRILLENVLIFTEEFIGPDLRELRSFVTGYLHRDFNHFRDGFERLKGVAADLTRHDRVFRNGLQLLGVSADGGVTVALMLNRRFQKFLLEHPNAETILNRDEREQLNAISRRLTEFAVLHHLRRGITWTTVDTAGQIVDSEKKTIVYSRTTRPIDFGRPGVLDPMVHRFGLMYDIASFAEILGNIARAGRKGEMSSYRQMVLFQRKIDTIADRHRLQFEKFLGDGAFYTTRRAMRLVRAAVEIQRMYADLKAKGFAFNRGMRVALNHGYYRLLPMKAATESTERVMEFYGPGIVELSRLTTGKATKEIAEIQGFLISHGYDPTTVQQFFAPLARGVDVVDHRMHQREFYAYVNSSGHLMNEGIVASMALLQEMAQEIITEEHTLYRLETGWGTYYGVRAMIEGIDYIGVRLIGMVSLKGLSEIEVGEVVPFGSEDVKADPLPSNEGFVMLLRQDFHASRVDDRADAVPAETDPFETA